MASCFLYKRRDFITLVGVAAAWPFAARAQQRERIRKIGVLMTGVAGDAEGQARLTGFLQGLQEFGWTGSRVTGRWRVYGNLWPSHTRGRSRMRESRTYGSVRGACDETHVPTATPVM